VAITSFEIFNKEVSVTDDGPLKKTINQSKEINLGYRDNVFSINFVALSYVTPERNKYAYILEGFDRTWNVVSEHKATYTNLPAGEYVFKVKATNRDGVWNDEGTQLKIIIHPPFWQTNFFKFIYLILFLFVLLLIIRAIRRRTQRLHNEKIKELNQQKETEIHNAKINFFTMIAHEIRTPVTLIIGPIEKILSNADIVPKTILKDLNTIGRNSQRLLHLVNQLLDFRKIEQGSLRLNLTSNDIYQLLQDIWVRFVPIFEQNNIQYNFDCSEEDLNAVVDVEAITKSVSNLLTNALKYTRDNIILSYRKIGGNRFEISVTDNGKGISDSEKEKIFSPFYQILGESKEGTGIGLSLVKSIIEAHNGEVKVQDSPTGGAMFCLIMPIENQHSTEKKGMETTRLSSVNVDFLQNIPDDEVENQDKSKNRPALLIVEDNLDMRNFLFENFKQEYIVYIANNGQEGLVYLQNTEINLIISDLMMPEMDGLEFCKQVRSNFAFSHIPFVLLTAKNDLDSKIESMNFGADSYVEKPFSMQFLKAQIDNLIENRILLRKKYSEMPFAPISTIAGNSADEQFLQKFNAIIEQNISNENFSIDQMAEQLNISRSGLFAKIKTLAGATPNELIQLIRLKKAAEYISLRQHRINEIAFLVGFNNPSYFSKCFQKQFGMTPKEFENRFK
jgi:signal transduction histidine kinase/DNA-binding response OmpR family regulator